MPTAVEDICKLFVKDPTKVANCNEFIQAVAGKVGAEWGLDLKSAFTGNADSIRARFNSEPASAPFIYIGAHPDQATQLATDGQFVVGGLTKMEMTYMGRDGKQRTATMGHVVVVAPGGPSKPGVVTLTDGTQQAVRGGYPYCYQGAAHEIYRFTDRTQVDAVFPATLLTKVIYAYIDIQKKK
jgi:hypothetical protein